MNVRETCRMLNCSPLLFAAWVEQGCPVGERRNGFADYDVDRVRAWLQEKGITDWPRENDHDLETPIRYLLWALERREITPWEAEKVLFVIGAESWP